MGRLDYSIELPQRTIQDVQMPNLPDHLTYIEPGYGIGDMLAEIAKNIRAGKLAQVEENLKMAQAQNYQAEMADRQSRAAREQQELIDTRSAQQKLADLLNTPGAITNPELRAPLIAAFSRLGGAGANLAQATFGASDRERLQDQRFVGQGVLQGERLDAQRGMQSERIGAQRGMQSERLDAQADIANLRDATTRRGQDMTQAGADRRFQPRPITDQQGNVFVSPQGVGNTAAQPMMVGGGAPAVPSRLPDSGPLRGMNTGVATGRPTDGGVDLTGPLSPPTTPAASQSQELRQLNVGVKGPGTRNPLRTPGTADISAWVTNNRNLVTAAANEIHFIGQAKASIQNIREALKDPNADPAFLARHIQQMNQEVQKTLQPVYAPKAGDWDLKAAQLDDLVAQGTAWLRGDKNGMLPGKTLDGIESVVDSVAKAMHDTTHKALVRSARADVQRIRRVRPDLDLRPEDYIERIGLPGSLINDFPEEDWSTPASGTSELGTPPPGARVIKLY